MALSPSDSRAPRLHTPLFDRFASNRPADLRSLARDIADILGARRAKTGLAPGILAWGLPSLGNMSPASEADRPRVASAIAEALNRFEPRLSGVRVTPDSEAGEFAFSVSANLIQQGGEVVSLRILAPRRGGALGADVLLLNDRP